MDYERALRDLYSEKQRLDKAIVTLEALVISVPIEELSIGAGASEQAGFTPQELLRKSRHKTQSTS